MCGVRRELGVLREVLFEVTRLGPGAGVQREPPGVCALLELSKWEEYTDWQYPADYPHFERQTMGCVQNIVLSKGLQAGLFLCYGKVNLSTALFHKINILTFFWNQSSRKLFETKQQRSIVWILQLVEIAKKEIKPEKLFFYGALFQPPTQSWFYSREQLKFYKLICIGNKMGLVAW